MPGTGIHMTMMVFVVSLAATGPAVEVDPIVEESGCGLDHSHPPRRLPRKSLFLSLLNKTLIKFHLNLAAWTGLPWY
jgi:hypothetical protein